MFYIWVHQYDLLSMLSTLPKSELQGQKRIKLSRNGRTSKVAIFISIVQAVLNHDTPDDLLLDRSPYIGPLISRWELDKFKNCWSKSIRTFEILKHLYQQFSNLLISQRDMSGPRLEALSNNRWSGSTWKTWLYDLEYQVYITSVIFQVHLVFFFFFHLDFKC
jgi:hypothetical protein